MFAAPSYHLFHQEVNLNRKADLALELWNHYLSNNLDSLKIIGAELLHDAVELNNEYAKAVAYRVIGEFEIWNGDHESGVSHIQIAARRFINDGNYLLYAECLVSVGNSFFLRGDFNDAEKAYKIALDAGAKSGDPTGWFAAELNLAKVYAAKGDTIIAFKYADHYKNESVRLNKYEGASNAYGFLAELSDSRKGLEVKSEYLLKSIRYARLSNSVNQLSHAWNNLAIHHFYNGSKDSALVYFNLSLIKRMETGNARLLSESYLNLANFFLFEGQTDKAHIYADSAVILATKNLLNADALDVFNFKCNDLSDKEACTKLDSLRFVIDELKRKDDLILGSLIEIYTEKESEDREEQNPVFKMVLYFLVILSLGIVLYRS